MAGISRGEAGETSSGITEDLELEARIKTVVEAKENVKPSPKPKIQKVIFLLRDHKDFQKLYEPRAVSLGPIHHGHKKYELGEKYKLLLTNEFVGGNAKTIHDLYKKIGEKIMELRDCFEEEVNNRVKDDKALAWLLLVDGCAILQYIYCAANPADPASKAKNKFEELNIKPDSVTFTQQDLFLLENQLPYCLLKWLMKWSGNEEKLKRSIEHYIDRHIKVPQPVNQSPILSCKCLSSLSRYWCQQAENEKKESCQSSTISCACLRLLSCLLSWRPLRRQKQQPAVIGKEEIVHCSIKMDGNGDPVHLLDLLRTRLLGKHQQIKPEKPNGEAWQSYRNVQELRAAGIHVERSKEEHSRLSDISFTTLGCLGYLWLPPISVDDSTRPKFLNLIAYEMCLDFKNDFGITSYILFLDSLIDEPNDVKILRKAGILYNCLGSDEEVAQVFNGIGTDLVPNSEIYSNIRLQIQKHYENQFLTLLAQFYYEHFSSPWTFMAFVGALLALALTIMQTKYTIIQTKYTINSPPGPCDNFCKNFT
ncbi:hypothetical protein ACJW31_09G156700 [Castanea mollissima]